MLDQTTLEHRVYPKPPETHRPTDRERNGYNPGTRMGRGIAGFSSDVLSLIELQASLYSTDVKEVTGKSVIPAGLLLMATAILLSCFPVVLFALGYWLSSTYDWTLASSLLASAGIGLVVAAVIGTIAALVIRSNLKILARSQYELKRNIAWVKAALSSR